MQDKYLGTNNRKSATEEQTRTEKKVGGKKKERAAERLSKWQHFCTFFVSQKAPGTACSQSDQQI